MWTSWEILIFTEKTYRSENSPTCENAVARTHGSWMLRAMGFCPGLVFALTVLFFQLGRGQGGGNPGVMGAGGWRRGGGSRERWQNCRNIGTTLAQHCIPAVQIISFCIGTISRNRKNTQRRELLQKWAGTYRRVQGAEGRKFRSPVPPPPPPPNTARGCIILLIRFYVRCDFVCHLRPFSRGFQKVF